MELFWQEKKLHIGEFPSGQRNQITDVEGVLVGHKTIAEEEIQTGLTVITLPGFPFIRYEAATYVFNGFGKSVGIMQLNELGELETPIVLTNTYSVPACAEGLIDAMCQLDKERGRSKGTINPLIFECNDGYLNDIQKRYIKPQDVKEVLKKVSTSFAEGSVGAGRGMSAYQLKGGIGSASRVIGVGEKKYTMGVLSLTNMGLLKDFKIEGMSILHEEKEEEADKGSMINILITDAPLLHRQLMRIAKRCAIGLANTGARFSNGSGDIFTAISTQIPMQEGEILIKKSISDCNLDRIFRCAIECTEEAVLSASLCAETVVGRDGNTRESLLDYLNKKR